MSAKVMGAVMERGPLRPRLRLALVGIADNADDYGFAVLSIATIAAKALCDVRTAMRVVRELEREQWLEIRRRVVGGKGNVYFVRVEKLGLVPDKLSRKSAWHVDFERGAKVVTTESGDKMSRDGRELQVVSRKPCGGASLQEEATTVVESSDKMSPENGVQAVDSFFAPQKSGDIVGLSQVTFLEGSGDILGVPILKNHKNHWNPNNTPLPPSGARGECEVNRETPVLLGEEPDWDELQAERVMAACQLSNPRNRGHVLGALRLEMHRAGLGAEAVADAMIEAWQVYGSVAYLMRFSWGALKFLRDGHWRSDATWPLPTVRSVGGRKDVGLARY